MDYSSLHYTVDLISTQQVLQRMAALQVQQLECLQANNGFHSYKVQAALQQLLCMACLFKRTKFWPKMYKWNTDRTLTTSSWIPHTTFTRQDARLQDNPPLKLNAQGLKRSLDLEAETDLNED